MSEAQPDVAPPILKPIYKAENQLLVQAMPKAMHDRGTGLNMTEGRALKRPPPKEILARRPANLRSRPMNVTARTRKG